MTRTGWSANPGRITQWACRPAPDDVLEFHRALPGYSPTPLIELPRTTGSARLFAKDESKRFGLAAFKALGASWALHQALRSSPPGERITVSAATDGNHGRAVAHFAKQFGHRATIFVPDGVHTTAIQAIRDEGATVTHIPGDYDTAVRAAAKAPGTLLVQDTGWRGYEETPGWVVDGYSTMFTEIDTELSGQPGLVLVPAGVGSLLQAALTHYRSRANPSATRVLSVEPSSAACVFASVTAGRPVAVATSTTSMAGLNCGTVSSLAWPYIRPGLDGCITVTDDRIPAAARALAAAGVDAGPCGAAPLAAFDVPPPATLGRGEPDLTVVLLVTEGAAANPIRG